jgi:hypothetical protein
MTSLTSRRGYFIRMIEIGELIPNGIIRKNELEVRIEELGVKAGKLIKITGIFLNLWKTVQGMTK